MCSLFNSVSIEERLELLSQYITLVSRNITPVKVKFAFPDYVIVFILYNNKLLLICATCSIIKCACSADLSAHMYRVTQQVVPNLLLTSKNSSALSGQAGPGQAKTEPMF